MSKKVDLKDIAKEVGVSAMTVSVALSGKPGVSEKRRKLIQQVADKYNYRPNRMAKMMRVNKKRSIGLIISEKTDQLAGHGSMNVYAAEFAKLCTADKLLYQIDFIDANSNDMVPELFINGMVGGCIYAGWLNERTRNWISKNPSFPVVCLEEINNYSVCSNVKSGIYSALQYLVAIGHRKIAFFGTPPKFHINHQGHEAFEMAVKDFGLEVRDEWFFAHEYCSQPKIMQNTAEKFSQIFANSEKPTAILSMNNLCARAICYQAALEGIKIPDDLSLITFGVNWEMYRNWPQIDSVEIDSASCLHNAVIMLSRLLNKQSILEPQLQVPVKRVERGSVKSLM